MSDTITTIVRHYLEKGLPKAETVLWKWVQGAESAADPGLLAKGRRLPAEHDPGLTPNLWVWVAADSPAAKIGRPDQMVRGNRVLPDGTTIDTVDHFHGDGSIYWDYYRLPLRAGVELIDEETWAAAVAAQKAQDEAGASERAKAAAEAREAREKAKASAREKLAALGLTEAEISALGA